MGKGRLNDDLRNVEEQMILDALRNGKGSRKNRPPRSSASAREPAPASSRSCARRVSLIPRN